MKETYFLLSLLTSLDQRCLLYSTAYISDTRAYISLSLPTNISRSTLSESLYGNFETVRIRIIACEWTRQFTEFILEWIQYFAIKFTSTNNKFSLPWVFTRHFTQLTPPTLTRKETPNGLTTQFPTVTSIHVYCASDDYNRGLERLSRWNGQIIIVLRVN